MTDSKIEPVVAVPPYSKTRDAPLNLLVRICAGTVVATALAFLLNNYLTFWREWPGVISFYADQGWLSFAPLDQALTPNALQLGWFQFGLYLCAVAIVVAYVMATPGRSLRLEADRLSAFSAYVVRVAFFGVLLIGLVDMLISLLRVEDLLSAVVGEELSQALARPQFRGLYVHFPLVLLSFVIGLLVRTLGFTWLALLVVLAEFQIVLWRFVFSYEQVYMGDLVRFWYAAMFLFASSYTLLHEGHVRVDVLYAHFGRRAKAWSNIFGLTCMGLPLCWIILTLGMWSRASSINSPLFSFEISQSGYGMYVKYLMAVYLVVFALSMIAQFSSYLLTNVANLRQEPGGESVVSGSSHEPVSA
ncbi:MAG: TRAP-type mannitol/chloroaromatic compound transport system permease small subunit [Motiliproteus sp.]|jgi:TRAP-type mannitol/chloroaromatic compound transport system permease small subunit